jgi:Zn-dependent protease/CBS domain-containing protein
MANSSFKLGRVVGIDVGIHYSWLLAFALVVWSLAAGFFPTNYPGWDAPTYWLVGVLSGLALFAAVLVHELSHSLVARARGQSVSSITLFLFGGVSNLSAEPERPADEFVVAIVGPLTSFVLALAFWTAYWLLSPGESPLGAILGYLAIVNVMLGVFNLLPGFPLDGGRVLRSVVWAATGSLQRATDIASYSGQILGLSLIFWGMGQMIGGNILGGAWIAFIGWFLNGAAETIRQQQALEDSLKQVTVGAVMNPHPPVADPGMSVEAFVFDEVLREGRRALPILDHGRLVGIVSITHAKKVPHADWATQRVGAIMTHAPLKTISPNTDLRTALRLLVGGSLNQLLVVSDDRLAGMLSRADLLRFLELRDELGLQGLPGGGEHSRAA